MAKPLKQDGANSPKEFTLKDAIALIEKEKSLFLMSVDEENNTLNLPSKFMLFLESMVTICNATEKDADGIVTFAMPKSERKAISNLISNLTGRSTWLKDGGFKYTGLLAIDPDQNREINGRMGWDDLKSSSQKSASFTNSKGL